MDAATTLTLRCSQCGVLAEAKCQCGAPYVYISPSELAAAAVKAHPELSDRAIAEDLGIDHKTVGKARKATGDNSPVDKRTGRDGRKRTSRASRREPVKHKITEMADQGTMTQRAIGKEVGIGQQEVSRVLSDDRIRQQTLTEIFGMVDFTKITAKQKLAAAIRLRTKELERTFEQRVQGEVKQRMALANATVLKQMNEASQKEQWAREFMAKQKKMGTLAEWNNLMLCLHPDTRRTASDEKFDDALRWVMSRRFAITGEK